MATNIRDILTCFSPNLDFFAITLGDGRIKIWDTGKGQVQAEFADIASTETKSIFGKKDDGHLSMDYKCMKWLSLEKKKKRKLVSSLLILGTGGGDVLALDVSAGKLKWRVNNCHPGGVSAVSFPSYGSHIYTTGADGVVCKIESLSGNLMNKFSASSKAVTSLCVSSDGNMIATAEAQLKIFNTASHKKLQKFSGHPGSVRCMIFSDDGRYVLSSSLAERYVAMWKIGSTKKKSACAVLAMDHPAVFLDCKCINNEDGENSSISVLAISEIGVCYIWHEKTIDELRNSKPTRISIPCDDGVKHRVTIPNVFAAKLQAISATTSGHVYLAYGFLIKPSFEKVVVQVGKDVYLNVSHDGILLSVSQSQKAKKASVLKTQVTALDSSNADGALLPVPMVVDLVDGKSGTKPGTSNATTRKDDFFGHNTFSTVAVYSYLHGLDTATLCMEDQLRSIGVLGSNDDTLSSTIDSNLISGIKIDANTPQKKMKKVVSTMEPSDAINLLKGLMDCWLSRSQRADHVLPWICCIMVYHSDVIESQEPKLLKSLYKITKSKGAAMNSLFQLSGRLQLVLAQVDKASSNRSYVVNHSEQIESSDDEDVEEIYGVDEDSQSSTDVDD